MSLYPIIDAILNFDIMFLIDVVMNNLFWVFGFIAAGYFFSDKRSFIEYALVFSFIILLTTDIFGIVGFSIYTAIGLFFLYLGRMAVLLFLEHSKGSQHLIPLFYVLVFYVTFAVAALGLI